MRTLFLLVGFIFCFSGVYAQMLIDQQSLYGNEWIQQGQPYLKINVVEDGIYKINFNELSQNVNFNGNIPKGQDFQLFHMGKELPIYVSTQATFGANDFIEFQGKRNRGWLDQFLYVQPEYQINPEYSLFSDTSAYFLTWNTNNNNARFANTQNNISNAPSKEPYCLVETIQSFQNAYFGGRDFTSNDGRISRYDIGEGYCRNVESNNQSYNINTPNYFSDGPKPIVNTRLVANGTLHKIAFMINNQSQTVDEFAGWACKLYSFEIPSLNNTNTIAIRGDASENDKFRVGVISIAYPMAFSFNNNTYFEFELEASDAPQYLEITNFRHENAAPILYDITNTLRIVTTLETNVVKVLLPPSSVRRKCVLANPNRVKSAVSIQKIGFTPFDFDNVRHDYIILTHSRLFDDGRGNNYVQQYADYRRSVQGGSYNPIIVDIEQIYNQFGYGINYHELGIRNFLDLAHKKWDTKHLFFIGKGVDKNIRRNRNKYLNEGWDKFDLVPPFGQPHSDYLFVMDNNTSIPRMAVGRIAAHTPEQIRIYLKKVKEFESALNNINHTFEDKAWTKRIIHFGGGDPRIQNTIQRELRTVQNIAENSTFGADVVSFFKNSTDVVQQLDFNLVERFINNGSAMMTFFGHSAPNTLDFSLGSPDQYTNNKRYPVFYAMGCNTNRVFDARTTLSEDWVFIEDKGAIAFFGSTALTDLSNLSAYGRYFYQNLGNQKYGATLGEIIQANIKDFSSGSSFVSELLKHMLMLHGDPALRVYPHETPDFIVNKQSTSTAPKVISVQADSFQLNLVINNLGRYNADSIAIVIDQILPSGKRISLLKKRIVSPTFEQIYNIKLPISAKENVVGINQLIVTIDADNEVQELPAQAEQNNRETFAVFISSQEVKPIFPQEFGIVNEQRPTLKASSNDPFSEAIDYYFELDTTIQFNSALKKTKIINQKGGLVEWQLENNLIPNKTYYWRVSVDSTLTSGQGFIWSESSFTYLPNSSTGWHQGHFHQFLKNNLVNAKWDSLQRQTSFGDLFKDVEIRGATYQVLEWIEVAIFEDGFRMHSGFACPPPHQITEQVILITYNPISLKRTTIYEPLGETPNCKNRTNNWGIFHLHKSEERAKLIRKLQDIPSGEIVALFTTQRSAAFGYYANQWAADSIAYGKNLFQLLEEQGAEQVRSLAQSQLPYIFIYQKDNPNFEGVELKATLPDDIIVGQIQLKGQSNNGTTNSTIIGPAKSWSSVEWQMKNLEAEDRVNLNVYGVANDGSKALLLEKVTANNANLSQIDARQYPYLQLQLYAEDTTNHTMPQLKNWQVLYESLPDATFAAAKGLKFHADTLQQGETLTLEMAIANPSDIAMDSLLIQYTVISEQNKEWKYQRRVAPLAAQATINTKFELNTKELNGRHQFVVELNPNQEQVELYEFNNIAVKNFVVISDVRNPLIDVAFDGVRILNGDIVSPKPNITVSLRDENKFLALKDTSLFELAVLYPSGKLELIPINDPRVTFFPAEESNIEKKNEAKIEFRPEFAENGKYQLQVKAVDATGNRAGAYKYTIDFEVITELGISNVFNYPNPFTTSTQFVFTLTGEQLPEDMKIQIMTISGRVVREIGMEELGDLKIGLNRTAFRWDGTDEYGDRLGNGVYLYRVMIKGANGGNYEKYDTRTDKYFKGEIGKMVLLR